MFIFLTPLLILMSCYVGASSIKPENKQGYFVVLAIILVLILLFGVIFSK